MNEKPANPASQDKKKSSLGVRIFDAFSSAVLPKNVDDLGMWFLPKWAQQWILKTLKILALLSLVAFLAFGAIWMVFQLLGL